MAGELDHLRRRRSRHAAAVVVDDQPLVARDPVATKAKACLERERPDNLLVRELPGRADDERDRSGQVAARVRVRPADVREDEIVFAEVLREPAPVDDGRQLAPARHATIAETISSSAAIPGRSASRSSQSATAGYRPRSRSRYACARGSQGNQAMSAKPYSAPLR